MRSRIPQSFLDNLIASVDIVQVVGEKVTIKKSGKDYMGCCPFHSEKSASFSVSAHKQFFHCFGCGINGNAIGFLMEFERLSFREAVEDLAQRVSLKVPGQDVSDAQVNMIAPVEGSLKEANAAYVDELSGSEQATQYLRSCGVGAQTAHAFSLGFVGAQVSGQPDNVEQLTAAGLLVPRKSQLVPWGENRITLPVRDRRGAIKGFVGQPLSTARPILSGESELLRPASMVYGLFEAAKAAQVTDTQIVVEKPMEVLALADRGVHVCVSTLNRAITVATLEMLFTHVSNVVFCFASNRVREPIFDETLHASLSSLKKGRDISFIVLQSKYRHCGSFLQDKGAEGFHQRVDTAIPTVDILHKKLSANRTVDKDELPKWVSSEGLLRLSKIPCSLYRRLSILHFQTLQDQ